MDKELKAYKDLDVRRAPTTPDSIYFVLNSTTQKVTEIWITSSQNIPKKVELNNSGTTGNISQFVNDAGYLTIGALPKTKLQYNTSLIDGDFLFVGDATGYTDEQAQDAVATILVDSAEIDFTYDDVTPSITAILKVGSIDETKLDASVNNSLSLANTSLQVVSLTNYFNKSVDDTDDVIEGVTNKFTTTAEKNKISQITVTQPVNLDILESDTILNNVKITNTTHTGDATGATVLTLVTVNTNTGSFGTASSTPQYNVNSKGLITSSVNTPIQITQSQVTGLTTDVSGKEDISNKTQTVEIDKVSTTKYPSVKGIVDWIVARFQVILVSGTNIKTIGGVSLLGSGDVTVSAKRIHKIEFSFAGGGFGQPSGFWWSLNGNFGGKYNPTYTAAGNLVPTNNFSVIDHSNGYKEKALFAGKIKKAFVNIWVNGGAGYVFDVAIVNYKMTVDSGTQSGFGHKIVARQSFTINTAVASGVQSLMLPANIDSLYNIEENSFFALVFNTGVGSNNPIQNPQIYVELEEN